MKLWEEGTRKNEYIYDCDSLQLAVKVGIIGVLIGIVFTLLYRVVYFGYFESSSYDTTLLVYQLGLLNHFSFIGIVFTSVGYVGIFSMKKSKLGIIFPLLAILSSYGTRVYQYILFQLGMFSVDSYFLSLNVLSFVIAIIGGLALLTLRRVSAHSQFLYFFVIFKIFGRYLAVGIYLLIYPALISFPLSGGLGNLVSALPTLITVLITSLLVVKYFLLEREQGCLEAVELQDAPFPE